MRLLLTAWLLAALSCFNIGYAQGLSEKEKVKLQQWQERCDREFSNPILSVLSGKISRSYEISDHMLKNETRPTKSEQSALAVFYKATERCNAVSRELYAPSADTEAGYVATLDNIFMLKEGRLTYAEYNRREKQAFDSAIAKFEREFAEKEKKISQNLLLSCTNEVPGQNFGFELQYQINVGAGTIWANRGQAQPSGIRISQSEFSFSQGTSHISISRASGRFSISGDGTGILFSGRCEPVKAAKF